MEQQEFYVCKVFLWILNQEDVFKMQELILSNRTQLIVFILKSAVECVELLQTDVYVYMVTLNRMC